MPVVVVVIKIKPQKTSHSSFACWELSRVNSFIYFLVLWGSRGEDHNENVEVALLCIIVDLTKSLWPCLLLCIKMLADSSLVQCTCTIIIIIIHTVRSCKWKGIMMIYDGLIEMREAGMNLTSLFFVNMISLSFLIQPIMNETCLQWQLEIIVTHAMLTELGVYNGLPFVPTCY